MSTILLVHGAWADGSSWVKLIPILESEGYRLVVPQLPLTSLQDDVATLERAIALESGPLLLVGHSYGGAVITAAGHAEGVKGLVYVAAFAPDVGESAASLLTLVPNSPLSGEMRSDQKGFIKLTAQGIMDDFAQDLSEPEKRAMVVTQAPTSINALSGSVTSAAWRSKSCWYIVAENDRTMPPRLQEMMANKLGADTVSIPTSHVAMLSHPFDVAAVVLRAAKAVFVDL